MFSRQGLIFLCVTAWMSTDIKVEAYLSGCSGEYCFVISDISHTNELLDQSNAQQRCRSNGSQLAEIQNEDIQNSLVDFSRTANSQGFNNWNVLTNGKRSIGNWIRLSGNGIGGGLTVSEQTDQSYAYGYLKSTTSGLNLFASKPTNMKEGFICSGLTDCSGEAMISGQCYKSFTETLSWYDARNRCLDAGGDLASFDYITTNDGFKALNRSWIDTSKSYWIGIRREWWTWQGSNSDVKYSYWLAGHPINDAGRDYSDCLCLSTTYWKWIECGCYASPFVCISAPPTTTTIRRTPYSSWSTATDSAIISESNGASSPTDTTTGTLKSTGNGTGGVQQSMAGSGSVIGIGVGVGVGGALIVIALIAAVIILCRKRCPFRCPERKKTNAKPQPPDILMKDGTEDPYAQVVSSSPELNNTDATIVYTNDNQTHTVYAPIGFCTEPQLHHDGNVTIVAGKTGPSPATIPPKNNAATNHFKVGGDLYAEVTKA